MAVQNGCARYQSTHGLCPLRLLQLQQQAIMFERTVRPPCTLGMTWSSVGLRPRSSPQYAQR